MKRKTLDKILTLGGALVVVVLLAAGGLLMWGYSYANSQVQDQLSAQQIYFPTAGSAALAPSNIGPYLDQYAGQQLTTGPQAEAYADHFIQVHLDEMAGGKTYAQLSAESLAQPNNTALKAQVQTMFQGTTLRSMLLEAYGFWTFGQIALYGAIASFIGAGLMAILVGLGIWHTRRVAEDTEAFVPRPTTAAA